MHPLTTYTKYLIVRKAECTYSLFLLVYSLVLILVTS